MTIKTNLTSDEIGELSDDVRAMYVQDGDGYRLNISDADAEEIGGLKNIKSALQKEREANKASEKVIAQWALLGGTPDEVQKRLSKKNDLDPPKDWDIESILEKQRLEHQRIVEKERSGHQEQISSLGKRIEQYQRELTRTKLSTHVQKAAAKAGLIARYNDIVFTELSTNLQLGDNDKIVILDDDGDPTGKSLDDYFGKVLPERYPEMFELSKAIGSGNQNNPPPISPKSGSGFISSNDQKAWIENLDGIASGKIRVK